MKMPMIWLALLVGGASSVSQTQFSPAHASFVFYGFQGYLPYLLRGALNCSISGGIKKTLKFACPRESSITSVTVRKE